MSELYEELEVNRTKAQKVLDEVKRRDKKLKKRPIRIDRNTIKMVTPKKYQELIVKP